MTRSLLLCLLGLLAPPALAQTASPAAPPTNPETQVRQAFPEDPSRIPLRAPDGKSTTLGAIAPKVLLVSVFTSRFGSLDELKLAPHLMKALGGRKDVAFIALNIDRPQGPEDWDTLREVMKESGVDARLYSDEQLSFLAWVNGRPEPGKSRMIRTPSLAIILHGKQLHAQYGVDPSATPEAYVAERLPQVNEALKAVGARPVSPKKPGAKR